MLSKKAHQELAEQKLEPSLVYKILGLYWHRTSGDAF